MTDILVQNVRSDENAGRTLNEKLKEIRGKFLRAVPGRFDEALELLDQLDGREPEISAIQRVHRILHEVSGSAGTLGAPDLTRAVAPAFAIAESCAGAGRIPSRTETAQMRDHILRSREAVRARSYTQ